MGNALGAGDAEGARRAALATLALGGVIVVLVELVLVLTRHVIAEAFTANADVAAAVRLCLPWLCLEIGMDQILILQRRKEKLTSNLNKNLVFQVLLLKKDHLICFCPGER